MRFGFGSISATFGCGVALLLLPSGLVAQSSVQDTRVAALIELPDAPRPAAVVGAEPSGDDSTAQQPAPAVSGSSSSQAPESQSTTEKSQREKAAEQLKLQEQQRVMGVMATFNTTRDRLALPLSPGQKFQLFFKSSTDPWPFLLASVVSGIGQANDSYPEYGQGMKGYAKRYGAAYSDAFIGNFFGNAVLPSLLREDPRYFQKGTGSAASRFLWAASSTVWCRRDKGGWGPNYANVVGNLIGSAIARTYYPASERDVSGTISDGLTVSAEGIVGAEVIEFWPDLVRRHRRKKAEKLAREAAQIPAKPAIESAPPAKPGDTPQ